MSDPLRASHNISCIIVRQRAYAAVHCTTSFVDVPALLAGLMR